ncbi:DUF3470 domain-containing protein [Bradyrhizobium arachidis]|uniref:DUF3470 domain-containing protein n=2 Tax=Bradyrhizobium arachidis TaxID=858423 RepID=A0AAE7NUV1_9BRAD|nr:DUF3470 domain-containing protein [Bradyrhizobium arachidis]
MRFGWRIKWLPRSVATLQGRMSSKSAKMVGKIRLPLATAIFGVLNAEMSALWPNITEKKDPLPDAAAFDGTPGKFEAYFSKLPGAGS